MDSIDPKKLYKEAKELETKAVEIFLDYKTHEAIEFLIKKNHDDFLSLHVTSPKGEKDGYEIDKSILFIYKENKYGLYLLNKKLDPDHYSFGYRGEFFLYFNDRLMIRTPFSQEYKEDEEQKLLSTRMNWYESRYYRILKLDDFVEELPKIVEQELDAKLIDDPHALKLYRRLQYQKIKYDIFAKTIFKNFDLGKYE